MRKLVGGCLALLGWAASLVFRLVDWVMDWVMDKGEASARLPLPPLHPAPDRYDQAKAGEWGERMQWQEQVYEEIDEMVPYVREGDPR